jgi:predicted aspartyl protease
MDNHVSGIFDEDAFPFLQLQVLNRKKGLSVMTKAIIDTGAAHCLVREELAQQLQLETLREADYRHPLFGKMLLTEYLMDICFDQDGEQIAIFEGVRAGTLIDPHYPASVIIGVEVLKHCLFSYNGHQRTFTLGFKR